MARMTLTTAIAIGIALGAGIGALLGNVTMGIGIGILRLVIGSVLLFVVKEYVEERCDL